MANVSPVNQSSKGRKANSTQDLILQAFSVTPKLTFNQVHKTLLDSGWKQPASSSISTILSYLTNVGLLRQIGKDDEGNTVWERTALKFPLPDGGKIEIDWRGKKKELNTETVKEVLSSMRGCLDSLNKIAERGDKPNLSLLPDFVYQLDRILARYEGFTDRTNEDEYKRRIALGL